MNHHAILLTVAAVAAISGCSGAPAPTSHRDSADLVGEPVYQPMLVVGMPPLRPVAGSGRPIEAMTARGTPVADVLLGMFKDSDINLLIDQAVQTSNCTFDIKHATIEEAFESLLRSLDLGYEWDGNFLRIRDTVQRTFFVDLLPVSQETSSSGASTGTAPGDKPRTDFWTEIDKVMPQVLGTGKAIVNQSANTIHVEASPASVERLREVIDTTLRRRNAQVSLEARILEVRLNSKHSLGLNWSLLPGQFDSHKVGLLPGGALATQSAASGGTALNIGMLQTGDFSVFLDALAEQGQCACCRVRGCRR
jgi:type II secretory pathway component GspD/PulD (secretin)